MAKTLEKIHIPSCKGIHVSYPGQSLRCCSARAYITARDALVCPFYSAFSKRKKSSQLRMSGPTGSTSDECCASSMDICAEHRCWTTMTRGQNMKMAESTKGDYVDG